MSSCIPTVPHKKSTPTDHRAMPSLCSATMHHIHVALTQRSDTIQYTVHIIISRTTHALVFSRAQTTDIYIYRDIYLFFYRFVKIAHNLRTN